MYQTMMVKIIYYDQDDIVRASEWNDENTFENGWT